HQPPGGLERHKVLPGEAAIPARAALGHRDEAVRLVVAHLLHADAGGAGEVLGAEVRANCHVKLASAICDFSGASQGYSAIPVCQPSTLASMFYNSPGRIVERAAPGCAEDGGQRVSHPTPRYTQLDSWIAREAIPFSLDAPEALDAAVDRMVAAL